jgi:23S rRNA (cytosine1962-C5)-methyltransferase
LGRGRLHLRIRPAAEAQVRSGHPWVFADSVRQQNRPGQAGELVIIFDRNDNFLALGLYDPDSPICCRIVHRGKPVEIDLQWWRLKLRAAIEKRQALFDERTTGYRIVHGENDGLPALVLDRYHDVLVLKFYSAAWLPRLEEVIALIRDELNPRSLVLRLSRNIAHAANRSDGEVLSGAPLKESVKFLENGICFEADVLKGQKTGFFLDQRENRKIIESLSKGRDVLNAFSFSGGFSLYAARGGARSVTDLDISQHALESSRRNFALNEHPNICKAAHKLIQADAFEWIRQQQRRQFDLVILDPPSLARREAERASAITAYRGLNAAAIQLLRKDGILFAASCSAHVSTAEFYKTVLESARGSGRSFRELQRTGYPPDHPATFAEAEYLKGIYLRFDRSTAT